MTDFAWELEDGSGRWQLEDGTGNWLLELQEEHEGSTGGRSKQVGVSAVKKQLEEPLGQRIKRKKKLFVEGRLKLKTKSKSVGSLLINFKSKVEGTVRPLNLNSVSFGNIQLKLRAMSESKLKLLTEVEKLTRVVKIMAMLVAMNSFELKAPKKILSFEFIEPAEEWKALTEQLDPKKITKLWKEMTQKDRKDLLTKMKLNSSLSVLPFDELPDNVKKTFVDTNKTDLINVVGLIGGGLLAGLFVNILDSPVDEPISQIKEMPIEPVTPDKPIREPSFNLPSSFVGRVTYTPDFQTMEISLSGKVFGFCNVPQRIFDAFEGAGSKGAFFNRNIKTQFDC